MNSWQCIVLRTQVQVHRLQVQSFQCTVSSDHMPVHCKLCTAEITTRLYTVYTVSDPSFSPPGPVCTLLSCLGCHSHTRTGSTVYSVQFCSVQCTQCCSVQYTVYSSVLYSIHTAVLYSIHFGTVYSIQWCYVLLTVILMYSTQFFYVQYTDLLYKVYSTVLYNIQYRCSAQYELLFCAVHSFVLYNIQFCSVQYTVLFCTIYSSVLYSTQCSTRIEIHTPRHLCTLNDIADFTSLLCPLLHTQG